MSSVGDLKATARAGDGRDVLLRHVAARDEPGLLAFMQALSLDSQRLRFFSARCDLGEAAHWAAGAEGSDRIGILATDVKG